MEAGRPGQVVPGGVPVAVQAGRAAAAVPPAAAALRVAALLHGDVSEDAGTAAVVVPVHGAEAEAVLVDVFIGTADGVA